MSVLLKPRRRLQRGGFAGCKHLHWKWKNRKSPHSGVCGWVIRPTVTHCCCFFLSQEGVKTENDHINLKVAGQDGSVVQFKIKRHTPLSKLMKAYCERQVSRPPPLPLHQRAILCGLAKRFVFSLIYFTIGST